MCPTCCAGSYAEIVALLGEQLLHSEPRLHELADRRALPMLQWALERAEMPRDVGFALGRLGVASVDLVPTIRQRLVRACTTALA